MFGVVKAKVRSQKLLKSVVAGMSCSTCFIFSITYRITLLFFPMTTFKFTFVMRELSVTGKIGPFLKSLIFIRSACAWFKFASGIKIGLC